MIAEYCQENGLDPEKASQGLSGVLGPHFENY